MLDLILFFLGDHIFSRPTNGSDRGSLRDHDLTLIVRTHHLIAPDMSFETAASV